jgi:integrase
MPVPRRDFIKASVVSTATLNPGNALKRYVRPVVKELGIAIGGWHDFGHTLTTHMRGVHPKVISGFLGHSGVALAMNTYDHLRRKISGCRCNTCPGSCY